MRWTSSLGVLLVASPAFAQITFTTSSIARTGDPAPVPPNLGQLYTVSLTDDGQAAFFADDGIFLHTQDGTTLVVAPGDPVPGGGRFSLAYFPSVNELGEVAFIGHIDNVTASGIFLRSNGNISRIVRKNDPAPGGGVFGGFIEVAMKGSGEELTIAFHGYTSLVTDALYLFSHGAFQRLVRYGDPAPGGGYFLYSWSPSFNLSGQLAFFANLSPLADGIFLIQPDGSIIQLARTGEPAPEGGTYTTLSLPSMNANGDLAFSAFTSVHGAGGVFLYSDGQLSRPIRELDPAPGGGVFQYLESPVLNTAGQILFYARTTIGVEGYFLFSPETGVDELVHLGQASPEGDSFTDFYQYVTCCKLADLNVNGQSAFSAQLTNSLGGIYLGRPGEIDRVAGYGDPVEVAPIFTAASPTAIGGAGQVLFQASTFPGGFGLFLGPPAAPIVRLGDAVPGGGVFSVFDAFTSPVMNDEQIVFVAARTADTHWAVYSYADGALTRIARYGDPAPGGGTFLFFGPLALSNSGNLVLFANTTARSGIFIFSGGAFSRVLAIGDPAPGGGTFSSFDLLSVNDLGQIAFYGSTSAVRPGIFLWSEGVVRAIALRGDPAPGGGTFNFRFAFTDIAPSLNAQGDLAFGAPLDTSSGAVFKFSDDVITRVAGEGDPVPGGGSIFYALDAKLNDFGQVAFYAQTSSPSSHGIFLSSEDQLSAVVRAGDPAPGGGTFQVVFEPWLNNQTQVGFRGCTASPSTCAFGFSGVFEASPTN